MASIEGKTCTGEVVPNTGLRIRNLHVRDIRFPTSLGAHGSDAMHTDPDYSCAYVVVYTDRGVEGHGLTFTLGRGTEIVVQAVKSMAYLVVDKDAGDIFQNFGAFWRQLTSESQLRWNCEGLQKHIDKIVRWTADNGVLLNGVKSQVVSFTKKKGPLCFNYCVDGAEVPYGITIGPEKGVVHLATAAIVNALWDLWARVEHKPLWKLLVDMEPETLVSTIDFRYISDVVTPDEAIQMLRAAAPGKVQREALLRNIGYPAYTTQVGWLGYSSKLVAELCHKYLSMGFTSFKVKVGQDIEDDRRRCAMVREVIGWENKLMVDANQRWDVKESIEWMQKLSEFKPLWIEEPTSPDDILGHATISEALKPLGIGVATGEMICNRVMFKQFLQAGAMQFCQIDSCRIGGVNEILSVYLMAHKLGVPVCPHAGGVGLCEMVQHLQMFDFVCLSGTSEGRMIEYVDQEHEHFENPVVVRQAHYQAPLSPGYSTKLKTESAANYEYPHGSVWQKLFAEKIFPDPSKSSH